MPRPGQSKSYYKNRASFGRKRFAQPKLKDKNKIATVATVKRIVNRNVDKLRQDFQLIAAQNVTTTAVLTPNTLGGGAGTSDQIYDSFQLRYKITNPTLNACIRVIVFQWKDTTTPVVADLLSFTTDPLSELGRANDPKHNCGGKLHLLMDRTIAMWASTDNIRTGSMSFYGKKLLNQESDGVEQKNIIYIMYLSDAAATPPVLTMTTSLVYHGN